MTRNGILVTGGSGLVGAYAVRVLLERGERPVVFDVAINERLLDAVGVDLKSISVVRGDIIGSGETATGEQIVAALTKHFPKAKITLVKGERPMPYPEERIPHDQSRAREQLGYQPDYLLEKALADYAETLKKIEGI